MMLAATLVASGCGDAPAPADPGGRPFVVAVLQRSDVMDPIELVSSSALAVDLVLREAEAEGEVAAGSGIAVVETAAEDAGVAQAAALAGDPAVVAAVVTPFVDAPGAVATFLDAGVPVLSFSGLGEDPGAEAWRRLVPTVSEEASALRTLAGRAPCEVAPDADVAPAAPHTGGECSGVVWTGDADGALALRASLDGSGIDAPLVVTAAAYVQRLVQEGYPSIVGTYAAVPCAGIDTSAAPDAQRFVHAYQAAHGVPPGLCAAEAYGLARWLVRLAGGAPSREVVFPAVANLDRLTTPAGVLSFGEAGEQVAPGVRIEQAVGVRWLPLGGIAAARQR